MDEKIKIEAIKLFAVNGYTRTNNPHLDIIFELGWKACYNYMNEQSKEINKQQN